jgi:pilus assembly protein Flp/PilA
MKSIINREKGQGLLEYALIMILVVLIVLVVLVLFGPQVGLMFSSVVDII